jgi:predicted nucleic acid-binding protein
VNLVLDASVTMTWLLGDAKAPDQAYASTVLAAMARPETTATVPVTWGLEVANVLARSEARGFTSEAQSEAFLEMLASMAIEPDSATFTNALSTTLQLARRYGLSAYDASYLEVALRAGLPLATLDSELITAAQKVGVRLLRTE